MQKILIPLMLFLLLFAYLPPAFAQDNQIEDIRRKLEALKQKIDFLEQEDNAREKQQMELLKYITDRAKLNVYATLEYEDFDNTDSVFDARNVELLLDFNVRERFRIFSEIEFERTAKTSSGDRQGEVEVEQAWMEYGINSYINPRFGVILVPFGRYNLEHFDTYQDLTDRPIMARRVIPTTWAEAGAGFAGSIYLGDLSDKKYLESFDITYELYLINGLTDDFSDTSARDARGAFGKDNNNNKALVGRLQISPVSALQLGISGYFGKYNKAGGSINAYDIDAKFTYGELEIIGEFAEFMLDSGLNHDGVSITENLQGGYLEGRYHFWPRFLDKTFLGSGLDNPIFTGVLRAGYA